MMFSDIQCFARRLSVALVLLGPGSAFAVEEVWGSVFAFQKKMAEQGNVEAHAKLAEMYEEGRGTPKDMAKAIEWYEDAAAHGHEQASAKLEALQQRKQHEPAQADTATRP